MEFSEYIRSPRLRVLLMVLGGLVVVLIVFDVGVAVGYRKASFSYGWGNNYYRAFGPMHEGRVMMRAQEGDVLAGNGAAGSIISLKLPTFIIEDQSRIERVVRISDDTLIRQFRDRLSPTDLKERQYVVVIGSPNERSEIEARFIRVLPVPASTSASATSTP